MTFTEEALFTAERILGNQIVIYPTETIWGIGGNLMNEGVVQRIAKIKNRPAQRTFILLVNSLEMLNYYIIRIHPRIETMLSYTKRPITIIYPRARNIPEYLLAEDKSIAIRVTYDPFCNELINHIKRPLISTSANYSGEAPPSHFNEINKQLLQEVDYVVQHRQNDTTKSQPSVIARYDDEGELHFLR